METLALSTELLFRRATKYIGLQQLLINWKNERFLADHSQQSAGGERIFTFQN